MTHDHNSALPAACAEFDARFAAWLERDVAPEDDAEMEWHRSQCARCGSVAAEVEAIRQRARTMPVISPARDLWAGIESRLVARSGVGETVDASTRIGRSRESERANVTNLGDFAIEKTSAKRVMARRDLRWMGIAAMLLVAVTAGVTWRLARGTTAATLSPTIATGGASASPNGPDALSAGQAVGSVPGAPESRDEPNTRRVATSTSDALGSASPADTESISSSSDRANGSGAPALAAAQTPQTVASPRPGMEGANAGAARTRLAANRGGSALGGESADADIVYEREVRALRVIVERRFRDLDPATVRVLRANLDIIDRAIRESRKALADDPNSGLLSSQLDRSLEAKLELMRQVALL